MLLQATLGSMHLEEHPPGLEEEYAGNGNYFQALPHIWLDRFSSPPASHRTPAEWTLYGWLSAGLQGKYWALTHRQKSLSNIYCWFAVLIDANGSCTNVPMGV